MAYSKFRRIIMISVIINTATEELLQVCKIRVAGELPEVTANILFEANGLDPLDYTVREFDADYTTNLFKKYCYIENLMPYHKNIIGARIDKINITADGIDKAIISNCVEGASVKLNGEYLGDVGSDGIVEVTSGIVTEIIVLIEKDKYQSERFKINAT